MSGTGHGKKAVIAAAIANVGIAVAKFAAFLVTGSASMLAESVHSVADSGNQSLLLLGGKRAEQPASELHPFGHGRERYFWSFVVALVLFSLGSMFAIYEGVDKLIHPHELESPAIASSYSESRSSSSSSRSGPRSARPSRSVEVGPGGVSSGPRPARSSPSCSSRTSARRSASCSHSSASTVTTITDNPTWDAAGTISIGVLLGVIAIVLAIEMKSLLIGESATAATVRQIRTALRDAPAVRRLIHLRTLHLGPEELLVGAKVELDADLDLPGVSAAIDDTEQRLRAAVPMARVVYLEPDVYDAARDDAGPPGARARTHLTGAPLGRACGRHPERFPAPLGTGPTGVRRGNRSRGRHAQFRHMPPTPTVRRRILAFHPSR